MLASASMHTFGVCDSCEVWITHYNSAKSSIVKHIHHIHFQTKPLVLPPIYLPPATTTTTPYSQQQSIEHTHKHSQLLPHWIATSTNMRHVRDAYSHSNFQPQSNVSVSADDLSSWACCPDDTSQLQRTDYSTLEPPRHRASPFQCSDRINRHFVLWYVRPGRVLFVAISFVEPRHIYRHFEREIYSPNTKIIIDRSA